MRRTRASSAMARSIGSPMAWRAISSGAGLPAAAGSRSKRTTGPGAEDERTIVAQPLFHMNGLFATKTVFANNASMVMMPAFETRAYTAALAKYRVTAIAAIPTMLARVIKETDLLAT